MELFQKPRSRKRRLTEAPSPKKRPTPHSEEGGAKSAKNFAGLGLCDWVLRSCRGLGFVAPTPVQVACIPEILAGRNVLGCAETGSGKTAAFVLPLLQRLSQEPYGVFGVVLTPTRELALQVGEQFAAFGGTIGLRMATVIGGVDLVTQSLELQKRPHIIVATPGRLASHIRGTSSPFLRKVAALVLDEADRLLTGNFGGDLETILEALPTPDQRQTLLFSATMDSSLNEAVESVLRITQPVFFDLTTPEQRMPNSLEQQYVFMPEQLKLAYLAHLLNELTDEGLRRRDGEEERKQSDEIGEKYTKNGLPLARSAIIFTGTCKTAAEVKETLSQLMVPCVALHSIVGQRRRSAALGAFKSHQVKLLVATDVASRGLDIPTVDLVIHYDVPRDPADYVHRCGRTARAGQWGRSVAMVTQYDVRLIHAIEERTNKELSLCQETREDEALKLLNAVSKALRGAKTNLAETGFMDRHDRQKSRKRRQEVKEAD